MGTFWKRLKNFLFDEEVQATEAKKRVRKTTKKIDQSPIQFNIGVDFGTTFTKVCYRDVGLEISGIVTFGDRLLESGIIPSYVTIDSDGELGVATADPLKESQHIVRYLKMHLAGMSISDEISSDILADMDSIKALSAFFLSKIVEQAQNEIKDREKAKIVGRDIIWTGNVGVPVEHYDSSSISVFREVFAVAWEWAQSKSIPSDLNSVIKGYKATADAVDLPKSGMQAVPEIAGAIHSLVERKSAEEGIYIYVDIGGGTLDSVVFRFMRPDGEPKINCYSGRVAALGVEQLVSAIEAVSSVSREKLMNAIVSSDSSAILEIKTGELDDILKTEEDKLRRIFAPGITQAKRKDRRDWSREGIQPESWQRYTSGAISNSNMVPLVIFTGGGAANSNWYIKTLNSTHYRHGLENVGIPPFSFEMVPNPSGIRLDNIGVNNFHRFSIAYGLSFPYLEITEFTPPTQFEELERIFKDPPKGVINYVDTKELE